MEVKITGIIKKMKHFIWYFPKEPTSFKIWSKFTSKGFKVSSFTAESLIIQNVNALEWHNCIFITLTSNMSSFSQIETKKPRHWLTISLSIEHWHFSSSIDNAFVNTPWTSSRYDRYKKRIRIENINIYKAQINGILSETVWTTETSIVQIKMSIGIVFYWRLLLLFFYCSFRIEETQLFSYCFSFLI